MNQEKIEQVAFGLKIFGVVLGLVVVVAAIVSLVRPAVTEGPQPPMPTETR